AEVKINAVHRLPADTAGQPDPVAVGDARRAERLVPYRRLVVRPAGADLDRARGSPADTDRVAEAVLPVLGLDDCRWLRVVELEDDLVEERPARPRDVGHERPARVELLERAQPDALGQVDGGVRAGVDERPGYLLQDRRLLRDLEVRVPDEIVMDRRAVGDPDAQPGQERHERAEIVAGVPVVAANLDPPA